MDKTSISYQIKQYTNDLISQGLYRKREIHDEHKDIINFSSNDYLGLSSEKNLSEAYQQGFARYKSGSTGSMVVCGYHNIHKELEQEFKTALKVDDCLIFPSGYAANLSVMALLSHFKINMLIDKGVHASIYDGLKYSNAKYIRFLHNNLSDLALKINKSLKTSVIITESIFSMSGQISPLKELSKFINDNIEGLIVDEAHAFGVIGREGLGAVEQDNLSQDLVPLRIIPFGKAMAASGAIVAGSGEWIDALLQLSRPYIYSTAISPAYTYGILKSFEIIRAADSRRAKLRELIYYFRSCINSSGHKWRDSSSPIQQLQLGCPEKALAYSLKLRDSSIICAPMRQPTVSKSETGLRVILNYNHSFEQIDSLFEVLNKL